GLGNAHKPEEEGPRRDRGLPNEVVYRPGMYGHRFEGNPSVARTPIFTVCWPGRCHSPSASGRGWLLRDLGDREVADPHRSRSFSEEKLDHVFGRQILRLELEFVVAPVFGQ